MFPITEINPTHTHTIVERHFLNILDMYTRITKNVMILNLPKCVCCFLDIFFSDTGLLLARRESTRASTRTFSSRVGYVGEF